MKTLWKKLIIGTMASVLAFGANASFAGDPSGTGDVVGRDMAVRGLGVLGHVGMWDGSKVLEVLNESTVIQKNTLANFKGRVTNYWGARYGKGNSPYKAVNFGWDQRNYSPSYKWTATYQVGKWVTKSVWDSSKRKYVQKRVMQTAQYRCDTFVYASYLHGDGTKLVTLTTPGNVYNSMPKSR